jgi:hypothetical protein
VLPSAPLFPRPPIRLRPRLDPRFLLLLNRPLILAPPFSAFQQQTPPRAPERPVLFQPSCELCLGQSGIQRVPGGVPTFARAGEAQLVAQLQVRPVEPLLPGLVQAQVAIQRVEVEGFDEAEVLDLARAPAGGQQRGAVDAKPFKPVWQRWEAGSVVRLASRGVRSL